MWKRKNFSWRLSLCISVDLACFLSKCGHLTNLDAMYYSVRWVLSRHFFLHLWLYSTPFFPPVEDAYKIRIRIDDEPANLDILDTAGQAEFTAMRDQYMRAGEGFIICYSITDRRSFHEVREFKQLIYRVRRTDDTPVVLVGNKSDLKQLRQVTKEEGLALAREFSCPFFETSAAYRYYIDDVFHALVREIRRKEKEAVLAMEKKSKPKNSVWKRLKSPFRKKKDSVTWREDGKCLSVNCSAVSKQSSNLQYWAWCLLFLLTDKRDMPTRSF